MNLFLVQHAKAKSKEEDPNRPLTAQGNEDIEKIACHLSLLNLQISEIFHSGKLRAQQTAEALSEKLKPAKGCSQSNQLSPNDNPQKNVSLLKDTNENILLVGHLPHLEKLASLLLCGEVNKKIISFTNAGVVCLARKEDTWSLKWLLTPQLVNKD